MRGERLTNRIDWLTILIYFVLVLMGWFNIYAADYDPELDQSIFDLGQSSGRQLLWIGSSVILIVLILTIDYRFYESFALIFYAIGIVMLIAVLFMGKEVAGSQSWFGIGNFRLQPSEFAKIATVLALAKVLGMGHKKGTKNRLLLQSVLVFTVPVGLIVLQGDTGTAMVYIALVIVLFREGLSPLLLAVGVVGVIILILTLVINQLALIIGLIVIGLIIAGVFARSVKSFAIIGIMTILSIGMVKSVDFLMSDVLKPHQQKRVMSLLNPNADPLGVGWNVTQSKIAIGSGGWTGKGFLNGTQTKFDFVPEQTTDFIFCTIGEEQGWIGSTIMMALFGVLFMRIITIAERQKSDFVRIYAYGVLSILFFHFAINIAMTIGLFPVIGIPLPFFSYGGSSLWTFTILLFVLLKLDAHRTQLLHRW